MTLVLVDSDRLPALPAFMSHVDTLDERERPPRVEEHAVPVVEAREPPDATPADARQRQVHARRVETVLEVHVLQAQTLAPDGLVVDTLFNHHLKVGGAQCARDPARS